MISHAKRIWWEDGVLHEQDIGPADIYFDPLAVAREAMVESLEKSGDTDKAEAARRGEFDHLLRQGLTA